jgi:hypothetical protein
MKRHLNTTFAALAACLLTLGSIGAIVTVPPAQAENPAAFALPIIA